MGVKNYKCEFCGATYDNPEEMATCILKCFEEQKKIKEHEKAKKLQEEKSQMFNEIQSDLKRVTDKILTYNKKHNTNFCCYSIPITVEYKGNDLSEFMSTMERYVKNTKHAG